MIGIYKIMNPKGRVYIGQSTDIQGRWRHYKKCGCKGQPKLHASFLKYAVDSHTFEVLEECSLEELNERERFWQEHFKVLDEGLNLRYTPLHFRAGRLSEETKAKISKTLTGRKIPREVVEKWMEGKVPYERTEEIRKKCSLSKKGKPLSEAHKQALRDAKRKKA